MKKFLALMLALLMLAGALASCNIAGDPNEDTTPSDTTPGNTDPIVTPIEPAEITANQPTVEKTTLKVVDNKKTDFTIVYAASGLDTAPSKSQQLAATIFQSFIREMGTVPTMAKDTDNTDSRDTYEILVGTTNREESDIALRFANGVRGFVIKAVGKKLVINAYTDEALEEAVTYFTTEILAKKKNGTSFTFSSEDDYSSTPTYNRKSYTVSTTKYYYQTYTIVVPENCDFYVLRAARRVQYAIGSTVGALLPIVYDSQTEGHLADFEILIGNTNRTTTEVGKNEYVLAMKGAKIELNAGSVFSMEYAVEYAEKDLIYRLRDAEYDCGEITRKDITKDAQNDNSVAITERNGEIRMVVHNVWGWNEDTCPGIWNYSIKPYNSASQRNLLMANMYRDLDADIVLLQEYTNRLMRVEANHDISPIMESYGYAQIKGPLFPDGNSQIYTATPIFYKTDKLELLDSGVTKFSVGGGHDKFATWGVFKQKSDGKVFGAISVHMAYQGGTEGENYRLAQVPVVSALAELIRTRHNNCPVMVGGDMNCNVSSKPFQEYLKKGFVDVQGLSERTDGGRSHFGGPNWNSDKNIFTNDVKDINDYANAIDHLIFKGDQKDVTFNIYDYLTESAAASIADHMPLVVDFNLN